MLLSDQLQGFVKVCETGSVLAAAKEIGITQSALTHRLQALENNLKTSLFTRSRKGMSPTKEGRELEKYCRQMIQSEGELLSKLQNRYQSQTVEIGICGPSSIMRSRATKALSPVILKYPFLRLRFDLIDTLGGQQKLKTGESHFAILPHFQVSAEFDSKVLKAERYILVGHPKLKKLKIMEILEKFPIIDFDANDEMTFQFLKKYRLFSDKLLPRHFANNTDVLKDLLVEGIGISVLSQEFAQDYLKQKKLIHLMPDSYFDYEVALAWYPRKHQPDYFKEIIKSLTHKPFDKP